MIHGVFSEEDFLAAQQLHCRRANRLWLAFSAAMTVIGAFWMYLDNGRIANVMFFGGIGAAVSQWFNTQVFFPRQMNRIFRQNKALALSSGFTYEWDDEFLSGRSEQGSSKRPWADYWRVKEDEKIILIYHAENLFEMIPKRWFGDAESLANFRRLTQRVGAR